MSIGKYTVRMKPFWKVRDILIPPYFLKTESEKTVCYSFDLIFVFVRILFPK